MKNITFIALVSLSLTVAASAAVQNQSQNDAVYTLPAFNVTTERYTDAEKSIQANLAQLRAQAEAPMQIRTELPSLGTVAKQAQPDRGRSVATQAMELRKVRS